MSAHSSSRGTEAQTRIQQSSLPLLGRARSGVRALPVAAAPEEEVRTRISESGLDGSGECDCIALMKTKMLVVLLGGLVLVSGCVSTVNDRHAFALWPGSDSYESRYKRSVDQVYAAALDVLKANGTVLRETILNPGQGPVKTIEAKVNGRNVWVRVEPVDSEVTSVTVQVRTSVGTDQALTQSLQNQIGIKLAAG